MKNVDTPADIVHGKIAKNGNDAKEATHLVGSIENFRSRNFFSLFFSWNLAVLSFFDHRTPKIRKIGKFFQGFFSPTLEQPNFWIKLRSSFWHIPKLWSYFLYQVCSILDYDWFVSDLPQNISICDTLRILDGRIRWKKFIFWFICWKDSKKRL